MQQKSSASNRLPFLHLSDRVEKKERARLKTVKFNSKARGEKGVSLDPLFPTMPSLYCQHVIGLHKEGLRS